MVRGLTAASTTTRRTIVTSAWSGSKQIAAYRLSRPPRAARKAVRLFRCAVPSYRTGTVDQLDGNVIVPRDLTTVLVFLAAAAVSPVSAQVRGGRGPQQPAVTGPWSDTKKSPDERAELLLKEMKLDEKITLVHGAGRGFGAQQTPAPAGPAISNGGGGVKR